MLNFYLSLIEDPEMKKRFIFIYDKYDEKMKSISMAILNHDYYADEALSRAWESIAVNIDTLAKLTDDKIESYLKKTIRNHALNCLKIKNIDANLIEFDENYFYAINNADIQSCMNDDIEYKLISLLSQLDYIYREVLTYQLVYNLSIKAIAKTLNVNEQTVKTRLRRGKINLKELLKQEE